MPKHLYDQVDNEDFLYKSFLTRTPDERNDPHGKFTSNHGYVWEDNPAFSTHGLEISSTDNPPGVLVMAGNPPLFCLVDEALVGLSG